MIESAWTLGAERLVRALEWMLDKQLDLGPDAMLERSGRDGTIEPSAT